MPALDDRSPGVLGALLWAKEVRVGSRPASGRRSRMRFCGSCSRARLSSEGKFYTCLFATQGLDLRAPLRAGAGDADILQLIRGVWNGRTDRYSELREQLRRTEPETKKIEMNYIGG